MKYILFAIMVWLTIQILCNISSLIVFYWRFRIAIKFVRGKYNSDFHPGDIMAYLPMKYQC